MNQTIVPRPEKCHICNYGPVHPRIMRVNRGSEVLNEAHWLCPKCSGRFKMGIVSIENSEQTKKNP